MESPTPEPATRSKQAPPPRRTGARRDSLVIAVIGSAPIVALIVMGLLGRLSPNPIEDVTHVTGEWTLRFLVATVAITPLRRFTGWSRLAPQRRTLGLLAFGYAVLHALTWAVLDQGLHWPTLVEDLTERPFVIAGATGLVAMAPLALTSTRAWMRKLGRRWNTLHRLVWVAVAAGCVHYVWGVKANEPAPWAWSAIALGLFAVRWLPVRRGPRVA